MSYTGKLDVTATRRYEKTIISNCYYEGALKITRPVYLDKQSPAIYLIHVGGGYVDGDNYVTNIQVEENAEISVTTQSSTKVYRTPRNYVYQQTNIKLENNSVLEYFPDPLIAYKGAKFLQETEIHMAEQSSLLLSDIITPGWAEDGSFFTYDWIRSKVKIYQHNQLILFDHLFLQPDEQIQANLQMEGYTHIGTFLLVDEKINKAFQQNVEKIVELYDERDVRIGLSQLPYNGLIIRILANNTGIIEQLFNKIHEYAREELYQKKAIKWRKY